jgi:hypothetical protein
MQWQKALGKFIKAYIDYTHYTKSAFLAFGSACASAIITAELRNTKRTNSLWVIPNSALTL